jgi:hypothetical protein
MTERFVLLAAWGMDAALVAVLPWFVLRGSRR